MDIYPIYLGYNKKKENIMTRKDYTKIAEIIKYLTERDCESLTENNLLSMFVDMLHTDNPRFDDYKFIKACGFKFGGLEDRSRYVKIK